MTLLVSRHTGTQTGARSTTPRRPTSISHHDNLLVSIISDPVDGSQDLYNAIRTRLASITIRPM